MLPEITVHRPRGVLPKVAVHQRTVIDYQPSWLLLAIKAAIVVVLAKRKSRARAEPPQQSAADIAEGTTSSTPRRWRPSQVVLVSPLARRHRRQMSRTAVPERDVVGNAPATTSGPGTGGGGAGLSDSPAPATDVTTAGP